MKGILGALTVRKGMNAQMRRIDLICKLLGPLCIALIDGLSTTAALLFLLALNAFSVPVEYLCIAKVGKCSKSLAPEVTRL